jgi:protein involved in polysaccharide export with SLBB domain
MLEFDPMSNSKCGSGTRDRSVLSACYRSASHLRLVRHFGFLLLLSAMAATMGAQQQSQSSYPDGSQNSTTVDCSDPALASSSQCSGQNQGQNSSLINPQTPMGLPGTYGTQPQGQNQNYSDTEPSSRGANGQNQMQQPQPLRPEPLTEFQKFVASTTNQVLPVFGADLFRRVPSTFAPLDMSPVPADYVIGPDDELRIRVWGQVNFQSNLRVDRSGEVYLPQVGPVHVAGLSFSALDAHLRGAIGRVYRNFDLTVDIGQIRAIQVYVAGQARRPGVYTVSSLSTLVDALFASGGPSLQGSMRHIQLKRGNEVVTDFDLYNLLVRGDKSKDVKLLAGDVLFIPPVGAEVAVTGSVRSSAIYELRADEPLAALLADAGGVSAVASDARVSIERTEGHHNRFAMEVADDVTGLATPLSDGDLVRVFSIVPMYSKTVTLRGNIANPGRFAWHPGMHISDLIPDKDSLITRNYWWKRAQLGLPAPEFEAIPGVSSMRQPLDGQAITLRTPISGEMGATDRYGSTQNQFGQQQGQNGQQQVENGQQLSQDGLLQGQYPQQDGQNQYGQQQNQNLSAQQRGSNSSLASQQSGSSSRFGNSTQRTEVRALAPDIDWNYAVIERLDPETLKSTLVPFDLGKLVMQHDASQDLELRAGDVVSIFSEADIRVPLAQQTKLITLGGEFQHAGVYTVQAGETFRHLVERAGGFTSNAYLYGSEYTRESTRAVQQSRIDEYVQSLSMSIQRGNLAAASSGLGSAQDTASAAAAQGNERDLLTALRQIRATGRIVLRFSPDSLGIDSLPDISMEDGDHFIVPAIPATINVVGAVYNQNSFLYAKGIKAGAYLELAGGPNRDSDRKHEFLIRADGEVVSRDTEKKGLWSSQFNSLRVYPGDTIVVPEKTFKPSSLREIVAWSQLVSNFALGAAALSIL